MIRPGSGTAVGLKPILLITVLCLMACAASLSAQDMETVKKPASAVDEGKKEKPAANVPLTGDNKDNNKNTVGPGTIDKGTGTGIDVTGLPDSDSISFIKSLMALCFVLGLIFFGAYFFKKFVGGHSSGFRSNRVPINLVGHLPLGEKKFLSIVEIQGQHYFIGITPGSINLLSELDLDLPAEEPKANAQGGDFENIFKKAKMLLHQRSGKQG